MNATQLEEWSHQLETTGRVELRQSRLSLVLLLIIFVVFTGFGVAMVFSDERTAMLLVIATLIIGFFGVYGVPSLLRQLLAAGKPIVIDNTGVHVPGRPAIAWTDVTGAAAAGSRGAPVVVIGVSPDLFQEYHAVDGRTGPPSAALARANAIALPNTLRADAEFLATWIGLTAHRRHSGGHA